MTNIIGSYNLQYPYLLKSDNIRLLITSRQNTTAKKPLHFLVDKSFGRGKYISSLYPLPNSTSTAEQYTFDCDNIQYVLTIDKVENKGIIKEKQHNNSTLK